MARRDLVPAGGSRPIGRYVPGVQVDAGPLRLVFVSGQVATDDEGRTIGATAGEQAEVAFENLRLVLAEAGALPEHLVSVVIYVKRIEDFEAVSAVRNAFFAAAAPSSTLVEVSALAEPGHLLEVSGVAVKSLLG
ncbi:MAG TPA: RidA family protein [Solirubrobacterales bacterium]|nr:RidA family protein [Solirubrobacterales bacterium]